jgi:hypothetical protein
MTTRNVTPQTPLGSVSAPQLLTYIEQRLHDGHMAHQLTLKGYTYPFVDQLGFAAVIDPQGRRKHSLYAGLWQMMPGDLLYFFQADPQLKSKGTPYSGRQIQRGLLGIFEIDGDWMRGEDRIPNPTGLPWEMWGRCIGCGSVEHVIKEVNGRSQCSECQLPAHREDAGTDKPVPPLILSLRILVKPFAQFQDVVPDMVAYGDRTSPPLLWTGRHDNAMGAGKGSTIRHFLPEEALKVTRQMLSMGSPQPPTSPNQNGAGRLTPPRYKNGAPWLHLPLLQSDEVKKELEINAEQARQSRDAASALRRLISSLNGQIPFEYASSEVPVGYTSGQPDFVVVFRHMKTTKRSIVLIENKKGVGNDLAVAQVCLYVPWVAQMFADEGRITDLEIFPIVVARAFKKRTMIVAEDCFTIPSFGSRVRVAQTRLWEYRPASYSVYGGERYANGMNWQDVTSVAVSAQEVSLQVLRGLQSVDSSEFATLMKKSTSSSVIP